MAKNKPRVLGVIPARGGSKRLPGKNIKNLCGHPLISYTIKAAEKSKLLSEYLVSSEDESILKVARSYNAPTPFVRPDHLATDDIRNIDVVLHALKFMEDQIKTKYDIVVLLQPTAPIRDPAHIDEAIKRLWASELPTLAAVKGPYKKRDPILKRIDEEGRLLPYRKQEGLDPSEPFFIYNAALYAAKREYLFKQRKLVSDSQVPLIMDELHSTDVDEMVDFLKAEEYLKYLASKKESPYE